MEKFNIDHSLKDIPVPSRNNYLLKLLKSVEDLIGRMRWKAHFFLNGSNQQKTRKENYGFRTLKTPPKNKLLDNFEKDMINMVRNVEFSNRISNFQRKLRDEVYEINHSTDVLVKADKTRNIYRMQVDTYKKLVNDNLTSSYKKLNLSNNQDNLENTINKEAKLITNKLKISDRVSKLNKKDCYLLLKDHKPNFNSKITARLINPTRTEIGKISKTILEKINKQITEKLKLQQWISTKNAINWFTKINRKNRAAFVQFDIVDFYPSITEEVFKTVMDFAKTFADTTDSDWHIIKHCRKTLLCNNSEEQWVKNTGDAFDVAMGSLDSAQIADTVGLLILYNITKHTDITNVGLYRDDGLMVIEDANGHKCDKARKFITKELKNLGFKVDITSGVKIVNFLDVTFNLNNSTYSPYTKDNHTPRYINAKSNHPPTIIQKIPHSIQTRISRNSSNKDIFDNNSNIFNEALLKSGFINTKIKFDVNVEKPNSNEAKRKRNRNIIWFTPPFNVQVVTNIGRTFLHLIRKHFPKTNELNKIFDKNKMKVGYSCFENLDRIIKKHNRKIINNSIKNNHNNTHRCSCRNPQDCPLEGNCLSNNIVYQADISTIEDTSINKTYIGIASTTFKARYGNHVQSFSNYHKRNNTSLSTYYWKLKQRQLTPTIKWKIIIKTNICSSLHGPCNLCLNEKLNIINAKDINKLLNRRSEIGIHCLHRQHLQLSSP